MRNQIELCKRQSTNAKLNYKKQQKRYGTSSLTERRENIISEKGRWLPLAVSKANSGEKRSRVT